MKWINKISSCNKTACLFFLLGLGITTEMFSAQLCRSGVGDHPKHDSLWYWHPFSIDLMVGAWLPLGRLSYYQKPGVQYGGSLGMMITNRTRLQFWVIGRSLFSKAPVEIIDNGTPRYGKINYGGSLGGLICVSVFKTKRLCTEIVSGASWDDMKTNIINPRPKGRHDSLISVSALALSVGFINWYNTFRKLNLGFRAMYTYSDFAKIGKLAHSIGMHSVNLSVLYRIPARGPVNKRYYKE